MGRFANLLNGAKNLVTGVSKGLLTTGAIISGAAGADIYARGANSMPGKFAQATGQALAGFNGSTVQQGWREFIKNIFEFVRDLTGGAIDPTKMFPNVYNNMVNGVPARGNTPNITQAIANGIGNNPTDATVAAGVGATAIGAGILASRRGGPGSGPTPPAGGPTGGVTPPAGGPASIAANTADDAARVAARQAAEALFKPVAQTVDDAAVVASKSGFLSRVGGILSNASSFFRSGKFGVIVTVGAGAAAGGTALLGGTTEAQSAEAPRTTSGVPAVPLRSDFTAAAPDSEPNRLRNAALIGLEATHITLNSSLKVGGNIAAGAGYLVDAGSALWNWDSRRLTGGYGDAMKAGGDRLANAITGAPRLDTAWKQALASTVEVGGTVAATFVAPQSAVGILGLTGRGATATRAFVGAASIAAPTSASAQPAEQPSTLRPALAGSTMAGFGMD